MNDFRYNNLKNNPTALARLRLSVNSQGYLETEKGQICVPNNDALRYKLALEAHEPLFAGHFGYWKTYDTVQQHWWWPDMPNVIQRVVKSCPICQCDATKKRKDEGPYKPIMAGNPWEVVTVDFVSGFMPSIKGRYTACCVVCDRFTRMIHLEPCRDHASAKETVGIMMRLLISRHGCPRVIISDRGTQFDSDLWKTVWTMLGTRVALATTHHPQSNGLTERSNRTLISLIRKYTQSHPQHWAEFLPLFEFAYNSAVHAVTKVSPFAAERGCAPPTPATLLSQGWNCNIASAAQVKSRAEAMGKTWRNIIDMVKQHEESQQAQVAERENQRRGAATYSEGEEVLVHWPSFRPYADLYRKQRLRYVGPFKVKKMIGANVVELEGLPARMPTTINTEYIHPYRRDDNPLLASLRHSHPPPQPRQD